jgi:hypothetical protein
MSKQNIYLVAFYYAKPKPGVQTQVAGWNKDPNNIQYDERVEITRGLKKDTYAAGVIMNLSTKTVDRNRYGDNKSFDEMFKYFFKGYNKYITQVMVQLDAEYFNKMLDEMQAEWERASAEQEKTEQPAE